MDWVLFIQIVLMAIIGAILIAFVVDSAIRTYVTSKAAVKAAEEGNTLYKAD